MRHFKLFLNNSLLTEPSAPTARPPAGGSLRSPTPPRRSLRSPHTQLLAALTPQGRKSKKKSMKFFRKKNLMKTKSESDKFLKKKKS